LVIVIGLTVILLAGPQAASGQGATLSLVPASSIVPVGSNVNVDVTLANITGVYGIQTKINFDATKLQVVGGVLTPGACPAPDFVQTNAANNTTGVIDYVATQLSPTAPCAGGVVASINFQCIAQGSTNITFASSVVSDQSANALPHTAVGGTIDCQQSVLEFKGTVALQGWPDPSGVKVFLLDSSLIVDGPVTVGSDGAFSLQATDDTKTYRILAKYDRYLSSEQTGLTGSAGTVVNVGLSTLRAGDINGDGVINIQDLSTLGGNFNKTSPQPWAP
jgi:hypothetical protein